MTVMFEYAVRKQSVADVVRFVEKEVIAATSKVKDEESL